MADTSFVPRMDCLRACLVALFSRRKVRSETEGGNESLAFGENLGIGRDSSGAVFGRSIDEQELEKVNCWPYFEISQRELLPQYSNQPLQACSVSWPFFSIFKCVTEKGSLMVPIFVCRLALLYFFTLIYVTLHTLFL